MVKAVTVTVKCRNKFIHNIPESLLVIFSFKFRL